MTQKNTAAPHAIAPDTKASLRILATTDLHAHILAWDYYGHRAAPNRGLARVATLIAQARAEDPEAILLDNGDFLSGSGLGDFVVRQRQGEAPHPMIAAMSMLRYDAVNLGNHEFSHGLPFLQQVLKDAQFPVLCSNLDFVDFSGVQRSIMVSRMVLGSDGQRHVIKVGVFGLLPQQTMVWESAHLQGRATAHPMADTARAVAQDLRSRGADVVIAMAHTGLAGQKTGLGEDRCAETIAAVSEIDAVIAGHSHQVFPQNPPVSGGPAMVLPGFYGSHLGVLDLDLVCKQGRWQIGHYAPSLRPIFQRDAAGDLSALVGDAPEIAALAEPTHAHVITEAEKPVAQVPHRLHSYFSTVISGAAMGLIAQAQAAHLAAVLQHTRDADLPILSAVAPFKAGGRGGPENYTDLPAGPFRHHHAADLYMHPNSFVAFRVSGQEVALWLERAVSKYNQIPIDAQDAPLLNPDFPSFNCDMIFGVSYEIDLSQPAMFDTQGQIIHPNARRIRHLSYQGKPIAEDQVFALASNSYRREGQSGFAGTDLGHIMYESDDLVQDILRRYVATGMPIPVANLGHWRFSPQPGSSVIVESAAQAREVLDELAHLRPETLGEVETGFTRFRLHL